MAERGLAANALTTIRTLKLYVAASEDGAADVLFAHMINQASAWIESQLDRRLGKAAHNERLSSTGRQFLLLREWPILSVEGVTQGGKEISPALYMLEPDGYAGCLFKDDGWTWMGYLQGLSRDPVMPSRNIEVNYTAGYVLPNDANRNNPRTLPYDLEQLCIDMIRSQYGKLQNGGGAGLKSFAISDVRWEWETEIPASWQTVINAHRRGWV